MGGQCCMQGEGIIDHGFMVVREEGCRWVRSVACEVRGASWW
jgi:hypothetical protein